MVNTKRGRFTSTFRRSLGVFLLSLPIAANAVLIDNGVPQGTVGHLQADVLTGGRSDNLTVTAARLASQDRFTENVLFERAGYLGFVDPGSDGGGFTLVGSAPVRDPNNPNVVTSTGSFTGANQNTILWTAVSSIAPNGQVLTTRYTFDDTGEGGALGPLRFVQYLDEDVENFSTNVFFPMGSAGNGDLELFTFENTEVYGVSQSGAFVPGTGLLNAAFEGWAADVFDNTLSVIGQPVSPTGIITNLQGFPHTQLGPVFGPADIVSVLAWDVDPNAASAVITTSLGGIPISTQTVEAQPVVGTPTRCTGKRCLVAVTCVLPPGQSCANSIRLTVSRNALRTSEGTSVKQGRTIFASGIANVPGGTIGTVRLGLTPRARRFVRTTTKRRVTARLEITNLAGTTVSSSPPMRIRIRR